MTADNTSHVEEPEPNDHDGEPSRRSSHIDYLMAGSGNETEGAVPKGHGAGDQKDVPEPSHVPEDEDPGSSDDERTSPLPCPS